MAWARVCWMKWELAADSRMMLENDNMIQGLFEEEDGSRACGEEILAGRKNKRKCLPEDYSFAKMNSGYEQAADSLFI